MSEPLPLVAIVGRPNVGKSTLFNWLTRTRAALVFDEPGVTRDRQYGRARVGGMPFRIVDTGGFSEAPAKTETFPRLINEQVDAALEEADCLIAVFDGRSGLMPADHALVERLRKVNRPVLYVVNKIDREGNKTPLMGFYELGLEPLLPLSAEHHLGLKAFLDQLEEVLEGVTLKDSNVVPDISPEEVRITIVGRPNVGKSTLINCLLGEERSMVSDIAGTTRDSVDATLTEQDVSYRLVDTAGIRRKSKTHGLEGLTVIKSLHAVEEGHIGILVLDLNEGVTEQDAKIAYRIHAAGRGLLIFGNKLDLLKARSPDLTTDEMIEGITRRLPEVDYAPIIMGSALKNVFPRQRMFHALAKIEQARHIEISTSRLNDFLKNILRHRPLPVRSGKRLKIYYLTQAVAHGEKRGMRPSTPRFVCFVNSAKWVKEEDRRYLVNALRKEYEFFGNPVMLEFRERAKEIDKNP